MSAESPPPNYGKIRSLFDREKRLLKAMLSNRTDYLFFAKQIASAQVIDMSDGCMGSVKFIHSDKQNLGLTLAKSDCLDIDGVLISIAVNLDGQGRLYELDIWKVDFSPLQRYPSPELLKPS